MLEIYKLTGQKNCGRCGAKTCLAFSVLVKQGQKKISDCNYSESGAKGGGTEGVQTTPAPEYTDGLTELKQRLSAIDFREAAERIGGELHNDRLVVKILGRKFELDRAGNLYSRHHTHHWVLVPLLHYVIDGEGRAPTGKWITYREFRGASNWLRFYSHRCESSFQRIAAEHPEMFLDILQIFGLPYKDGPDSDISVLLYPLPKAPFLFSYYKPEDGLEAQIVLYFDQSVDYNIGAEATYTLSRGLVEMVEKLIEKHGGVTRPLLKALKIVNKLTAG